MTDRDGRSEETDAINDAADRILVHLNQIAGMLRNFGKLKPILDRFAAQPTIDLTGRLDGLIEQQSLIVGRLDTLIAFTAPVAEVHATLNQSFDAAANDARIAQLIAELKRELRR